VSNKAKGVLWLACLAIAGLSTASATSVTIGSANDGNCYPFNCNDSGSASGQSIEYQQVYDGSLFSGPVSITSVTFFDQFLPGFGFANVPLLAGTYQFTFAVTNKAVNGLSTNLASNITSGQALFLTTATAGIAAGFSSLSFNGTTPYVFDPASGNLLLDLIVTNQANVTSASYSPANGFDADDTGISTSRAYKIGAQTGVADSVGLVTQIDFNSAVPEPGTWMLLGAGLTVLAGFRRRSR